MACWGRLGNKSGVCTSSTRPVNPFEGQLIYETDTNRTLVYDNAAWLVVADNQVLSIDSVNGRVGIGTTTPNDKVTVSGSVTAVSRDADGTTPAISLSYHTGEATGYIETWQSKPLRVRTYGNQYFNTNGIDRVTINTSGNVGIGDTTPSYTLDVNGDINATGDVRVAGNPVGMVLVKSQDIGYAVSSVTVTNAFSSSYDNYRIVLVLQDSSNNTAVHWYSPQETGSVYNYAGYYMNLYTPPTGASYIGAVDTTSIQMGFTTANSTGDGGAMTMDIFGPYRSDQQTKCMSTSTTYLVHNMWGRVYNYTSLSAITFAPVAGNFNGGKILIYGYGQ